MRNFISAILICVLAALGGYSVARAGNAAPPSGKTVEVLLFHSKQRCLTCRAIEREVRNMMEKDFKHNSRVRFRVIDFSLEKNRTLARKHKVTFTSLILVQRTGNRETAENVTQFAFMKARTSPEDFRKEIAAKIKQMLR